VFERDNINGFSTNWGDGSGRLRKDMNNNSNCGWTVVIRNIDRLDSYNEMISVL
jgi:hypothetical protein